MLRKRLITLLTFNDGVLFRTKGFRPDYRYTLNFVDAWSVDEVIVLDVTRSGTGDRNNFYSVINDFSKRCFVPLTAGGGVRSIEDFKKLLELGADKVSINSAAISNVDLITTAAKLYGTQCVVASIDAQRNVDGTYEVFTQCGSKATGKDPISWARTLEDSGAGEILLTSMERDGSLEGYDLELCMQIASRVKIPVLISGGAGNWQHFVDGFLEGQAAAVCTTCIYHFTDSSIKSAKAYLNKANIPVRIS